MLGNMQSPVFRKFQDVIPEYSKLAHQRNLSTADSHIQLLLLKQAQRIEKDLYSIPYSQLVSLKEKLLLFAKKQQHKNRKESVHPSSFLQRQKASGENFDIRFQKCK